MNAPDAQQLYERLLPYLADMFPHVTAGSPRVFLGDPSNTVYYYAPDQQIHPSGGANLYARIEINTYHWFDGTVIRAGASADGSILVINDHFTIWERWAELAEAIKPTLDALTQLAENLGYIADDYLRAYAAHWNARHPVKKISWRRLSRPHIEAAIEYGRTRRQWQTQSR